jgi:hypothetical protein
MWRYLAGGVAALLLGVGGMLIWQGVGDRPKLAIGPAPAHAAEDPVSAPPAATEATREEKRFNRYDKDRNGTVTSEEYLAARRKAYAKLDVNGDGKLDFDEWAVKATTKFAGADADKSGTLTAREFETTKVVRKEKAIVPCKPAADSEES